MKNGRKVKRKSAWRKPVITRIELDNNQAILEICRTDAGLGWPAVFFSLGRCVYVSDGYRGSEATQYCGSGIRGYGGEIRTTNDVGMGHWSSDEPS